MKDIPMNNKLYFLVFALPSCISAMENDNEMKEQYSGTQVVLDMGAPQTRKTLITSDPLFSDDESNYEHPLQRYKSDFLRKTPYFSGKEDNTIQEDMLYLQTKNPVQFGAINQLLSSHYEKGQKKSIDGIDPKDLQTVNDKILYAMVETMKAEQASGGENRKADLAQAARDRTWTRIIGAVTLCFGVPATVTGAVALWRSIHPVMATAAPVVVKFLGY
jgi:hypothetical protein